MLYPYITLGDGTEILHTHLLEGDRVEVHFERPIDIGFMSCRCVLPTYEWIIKENVSDDELDLYTQLVEHNADLIYKYSKSGGLKLA